MKPSIALIGAPGSGKTSTGRLLAKKLGREFIDVDAAIETTIGKPIAEIFADEGEARFRELEEQATTTLLEFGAVVSLGGGAVMNPLIRQALEPHTVVWLEVSIANATRRVGLNRNRPLLLGNVRGRLIELLRERTPVYAEVADIQIDTNSLHPGEVANAIVKRLELLQ